MKNMIKYFQEKIDKYVVRRFQQLMPKELIRAMYRKIAEGELSITTKTVEVKKGKIRYTLLIAKDKNLQTVFNLGRHYELEPAKR